MFIISLNYVKPLEEVERFLQAHVAYLEKYYAAGNFICSGRKIPRTGGIILAKANDRAEIFNIIKEDPFNVNGLAEYEVIEFDPARSSEAFKSVL